MKTKLTSTAEISATSAWGEGGKKVITPVQLRGRLVFEQPRSAKRMRLYPFRCRVLAVVFSATPCKYISAYASKRALIWTVPNVIADLNIPFLPPTFNFVTSQIEYWSAYPLESSLVNESQCPMVPVLPPASLPLSPAKQH